MYTIDITLDDKRWKKALPGGWCEKVCAAALKRAGVADGGVSVLFTDDKRMRELNRDFRGKDKPTNVLSFPAQELTPGKKLKLPKGAPLGDIALSYDTIAREAEEEGRSLADHTAHMLVHGVLHLLGHDHQADKQAEIMEAMETEVLASLGVQNPYNS